MRLERTKRFKALLPAGAEEVLLGGEMAVRGHPTDAGALSDVGHHRNRRTNLAMEIHRSDHETLDRLVATLRALLQLIRRAISSLQG